MLSAYDGRADGAGGFAGAAAGDGGVEDAVNVVAGGGDVEIAHGGEEVIGGTNDEGGEVVGFNAEALAVGV